MPKVILMDCCCLVVAIVATLMFMAFVVVDMSMEWCVETTRSNIVMLARFSQAPVAWPPQFALQACWRTVARCDAESSDLSLWCFTVVLSKVLPLCGRGLDLRAYDSFRRAAVVFGYFSLAPGQPSVFGYDGLFCGAWSFWCDRASYVETSTSIFGLLIFGTLPLSYELVARCLAAWGRARRILEKGPLELQRGESPHC